MLYLALSTSKFLADTCESLYKGIRVVLAVKPLRILPRLTRFSRRDSALSSQDVSDELSEKEATPFLLFFSTILVASVTGLLSILTFFFEHSFLESL